MDKFALKSLFLLDNFEDRIKNYPVHEVVESEDVSSKVLVKELDGTVTLYVPIGVKCYETE